MLLLVVVGGGGVRVKFLTYTYDSGPSTFTSISKNIGYSCQSTLILTTLKSWPYVNYKKIMILNYE